MSLISGHTCENMILKASWKSEINFTKTFFPAQKIVTDNGACCFISPYANLEKDFPIYGTQIPPKGNFKNGVKNGLELTLDTELLEYTKDWFQPTGFTIALADYTERPQVSQIGFYASPGHETRVSITATITNTTRKAIGK